MSAPLGDIPERTFYVILALLGVIAIAIVMGVIGYVQCQPYTTATCPKCQQGFVLTDWSAR